MEFRRVLFRSQENDKRIFSPSYPPVFFSCRDTLSRCLVMHLQTIRDRPKMVLAILSHEKKMAKSRPPKNAQGTFHGLSDPIGSLLFHCLTRRALPSGLPSWFGGRIDSPGYRDRLQHAVDGADHRPVHVPVLREARTAAPSDPQYRAAPCGNGRSSGRTVQEDPIGGRPGAHREISGPPVSADRK